MADKQALAQLHDIHMPASIGFWPLAAGWWALAFIFLIVVLIASYYFFKQQAKNKPKRQALRLLTLYEQAYREQADVALAAAQVGELLKRVALVYYPRHNVASLQGHAWIEFLNQSSHALDFTALDLLLLQAPYQLKPEGDLSLLFDTARKWILQRSYHV